MDHSIVLFLNQLALISDFSKGKTIFFAQYFPYALAAIFLAAVCRLATGRRERIAFFLEGVIAVFLSRAVLVDFIRLFLHRLRPYLEDPAITALLSGETSYSFPSGHAAFFFALAAVLYAHNRKWGAWFFAGAAVIGLARIVAGVHYPSDIVGGAILGTLVGWGVIQVMRSYQARA